jgi:probable rRNA maturation factor
MLDCAVIREGWTASIDWDAVLSGAVQEAVATTPYAHLEQSKTVIEVSIRLTSDEEVQQLNATYRGKDKPTNVLSFPMVDADSLYQIDQAESEILLGDIVLAQETCIAESAEKEISVEAHATHLVVHGLLHLLGYDHLSDEDAQIMESIERRTLANLGLHDPYGDE